MVICRMEKMYSSEYSLWASGAAAPSPPARRDELELLLGKRRPDGALCCTMPSFTMLVQEKTELASIRKWPWLSKAAFVAGSLDFMYTRIRNSSKLQSLAKRDFSRSESAI